MTGKTVDEAVEAACAALELIRDDVSVEVLEMPQKKLFGASLAKVRVYTNEDAFSVKELLKTQEEAEEKGEDQIKAESEAEATVKQEIKEVEVKKEDETSSAKEKITKKEPEKPVKRENFEIKRDETEVTQEDKPENGRELVLEELPISVQAAFIYLQDVAKKMKADRLTFKAVEFDGGVKMVVDGDDAAMLIGRRGETMDALQYLCLLVGNRAGGDYCKISLDVANYRNKREQALQILAKRVADKVLKSRRSQTLESMSPYERRIIHSTIQNIRGVKSESTGNDPNRRVVVFTEGDRPRTDRRDTRSRYDRDRNFNRSAPRREDRAFENQAKDALPPKEQDKELEKNLYGKIDI